MASTDYDFKNTRNEMIEAAFRKVGALAPGEALPSDMLQDGVDALNQVVKHWQTKHVFLWQEIWIEQTLSDGVASYDFPSATPILALERVYYRTSATGDDEPLALISYRSYCDIEDKDEEGEPEQVAVSWSESKYYLHPVPDTTYYFKALAIQKLKDFDTAAGYGDLAERFQKALIYQTAADLADEYNPKRQAALEAKARELWYEAKASDRERTTITTAVGAFKI